MLKAIDAALPKDPRPPDQRKETAEDVTQRPELHITSMDCEYFPDVSKWYNGAERYYVSSDEPEKAGAAAAAEGQPADGQPAGGTAAPAGQVPAEGAPAAEAAAPVEAAVPADTAAATDPALAPTADPNATGAEGGGGAEAWRTQPGWVIQMDGYHFHNSDPNHEGARFIVETFFKNLETGTVSLPDGPNGTPIDVPIKDLGIHHPVVITELRIEELTYFPEATEEDQTGEGRANIRMPMERMPIGEDGGALPGAEQMPKTWKLRQYDFRIQFCWQPLPRGKRQEKMAQKQEQPPQTAAAGDEATGTDDSSSG